jgi:hypothetical protein
MQLLPRPEAFGVMKILIKWTWIAMLLGYAKRYLNFTNSALAYCSDVVYPFFILHQTVIIGIGFYVIAWGLSGPAEYFVIALGTFLICGLLCELLIKKVNFLRIMFGMKWQYGAVFYKKAVTAK